MTKLNGRIGVVAFCIGAALAALLSPAPAAAQGPAAITRTPWQMYRNPIITGLSLSSPHGNTAFYAYAPPIPPANATVPLDAFGNGGWVPAPNGSTIGFGGGASSRLPGGSCFRALDFTFFQTLVSIPLGTTITTFTIAFSGMDDGSRVSIFNSAYPSGIVVPGSYVFLGGSGTTNLKSKRALDPLPGRP